MEPARVSARSEHMMDRLSGLEADFTINRETYFRKMLSWLQKELQDLHDGLHQGYLDGLAQLEDDRDTELKRLKSVRDAAHQAAREEYEREVEAARDEYEVRVSCVTRGERKAYFIADIQNIHTG